MVEVDFKNIEEQFRTFKKEEVGRSVTWSRNNDRDQLEVTISNGTPFIRNIKGTWAKEELSAALYLYQFTDAFRNR